MPIELVRNLIKKEEGIRLEFKEANDKLPSNLFETICAFLNREGGSVLLGVKDNGSVIGIDETKTKKYSAEIASLSNNKNKLDPPFILYPSVIEIKNKILIHIQVPASSQVHKSNGIIYDRSSDGDFKVTDVSKIAELYNRKKTHYTEGEIFSALSEKDLNYNLLIKAKNLIRSNKPNHPWLELDDKQFFVASGLYRKDYQSNKEGFTLAAALLFGKDEVIQNILPHYKIDALVKIQNTDRYDDRLVVNTNLIRAYDQLMEFVEKHLPDKFHLEGETRVSIRERIFREVVSNLIVHREYTNAYPASLIIYNDRVEIHNANNPNGSGPISVKNFSPYPKNPTISKFFVQLGRVEELGSGLINVVKYLPIYSPGSKPQFIEDHVFKTIIPINLKGTAVIEKDVDAVSDAVGDVVSEALNEGVSNGIIKGFTEPLKQRLVLMTTFLLEKEKLKTIDFISKYKLSARTIKNNLNTLKKLEIIVYSGSPKTGYYEISEYFMKKLKIKSV